MQSLLHRLLRLLFVSLSFFTFVTFATAIQYAPIVMGDVVTFVPYSHVNISLNNISIEYGTKKIIQPNISHPNDIVSYEWKEDNIVLGREYSLSIENLSIGMHVITLTIVDINGLSTSNSIHIQVFRENTPPEISIRFPQSIFTDTNMSDVNITISDPDENETLSITYEWKVNGVVVSHNKVIDNQLFKKHDILSLTVSASDNRIIDSKTSIDTITQEVLNSPPVIIMKLDKTSIAIGEKIFIDISGSYDIDGDTFTYEWNSENRQYNRYDSGYNMGKKYLEIDDINKSKIKFFGMDINFNYINYSIEPYGVTIKLDDGDVDGVSILRSHDIFVKNMDLFRRELLLLEEKNIYIDAISAVYFFDINNDSLQDIILISDFYGTFEDNGKIIILTQDSLHHFDLYKKIELENISPYAYNSLSVSDFNSDGFIDIAYTSPTMTGFKILYGTLSGDFIQETEYITNIFSYIATPLLPNIINYTSNSINYLSSADMNKDGKQDIVTIGSNSMTGQSTGMNIFLQNDINLSDEEMLVLDNRTIDDNGHYEVSDPHLITNIIIEDIDKNGEKDFIVGNYIEYKETNGTFTEYLYENVDKINFMRIDGNATNLLGIKSFDKKLLIYTQNNDNLRQYSISKSISIQAPNPYQVYGAYIDNNITQDIIIGHDVHPYFTLYKYKDKNFYSDQIYKMNSDLNINYSLSSFVKDIDNNGYDDIILIGRRGFEIFYSK